MIAAEPRISAKYPNLDSLYVSCFHTFLTLCRFILNFVAVPKSSEAFTCDA